jgi:hypothetical protein
MRSERQGFQDSISSLREKFRLYRAESYIFSTQNKRDVTITII